jgi:hypothetical protein
MPANRIFITTGFASKLAPTTNNPPSRYRLVQLDLAGAPPSGAIVLLPQSKYLRVAC